MLVPCPSCIRFCGIYRGYSPPRCSVHRNQTSSYSAPQTVTERMKKEAVLLKPGEHLDGSHQLDPTLFGGLPPGAYRIEAVLYCWKDDEFTDAERMELGKVGSPFLRGQVPASARIVLTP